MNALEFNTGAASVLAQFAPGVDVFGMPFLFEDKAQAYKILDSLVAEDIFRVTEEQNIKVLASWENGFRQVGTIKKPVYKLEDLRGLKIRTAPGDIFIDTWACLKAAATPIAWNEVFTALQTGVVDGQEVPLGPFYTGGFGEVVKYYSFINYMYDPFSLTVSMGFWNSLLPELQEAVQKAANESRDAQRAYTAKLEEEAMTVLVEKDGMTFITIEDLKPFQDAVRPVLENYPHKENMRKVLAALGRE
jgi:tripartite ATP-independent transporter DctP family solute receptor